MNTVKIPPFIKHMGHRIIGYILNLPDETAKAICEEDIDLSQNQVAILQSYIDMCKTLRAGGIDADEIDYLLFHNIPNFFKNGKHIFSIWHEEMGGQVEPLDEPDPVISLAYSVAAKLYPLFLIRIPNRSGLFSFRDLLWHLDVIKSFPEYRELCDEILRDEDLRQIFSIAGKNAIETQGAYMASTGHGGGLQLASFPSTLITSSHQLMRLKGEFSLANIAESIRDTIKIVRSCVRGNVVMVPVFIGFHNVGLANISELQTNLGTIRPYNEDVIELLPYAPSTTTVDGKKHQLGFILETKYPYVVNFGKAVGFMEYPKEKNEAKNSLAKIEEDIQLTFALACPRTPPVGLNRAWTLIVDPFAHGFDRSWKPYVQSPVDYFLADEEAASHVVAWAGTISAVNDSRIRIALRRVISAINERLNAIDGFIDTIIAWENLFGGSGELTFRISVSIAKLLAEDEKQRFTIQKEVKKYYSIRSKLVHGTKELSAEQAETNRNECLDIALRSIRKLYSERSVLIDNDNTQRSTVLVLSDTPNNKNLPAAVESAD